MACNGLKKGSFHFCTPTGLGSFLEKHIFDPFLTHFLVAKQPIFKAFFDIGGAKMTCYGLKMGSFHLCTPTGLGSFLENTFLTHFWSQNNPFSRHFGSLEGPKWLAMGSKWTHFTCLGTPNGLGSFLEKHLFDPFLTHFSSQNLKS